MKKIFVILLVCLLLTACAPATPGETTEKITLNVYNWGQYMADGSDGSLDVIAAFEAKYPNITVNYSTFESNEVMYTKLASGGITVDLIFPSDYMVARLRQEGMLQELNFDNIPNYQYVDDTFKNLAYDPENKYSVPYTWGTVGIIYNTKYVDEADVAQGWELLWNEKYADKILMFDNSRDAMAIAQYLLGYDVNTTDEAELRACADKLAQQKPLVQQYVMDQIYDLMENEEAWIAPYYAGDFLQMQEVNEDLAFCFPKQGFNLFTDAACIPTCAREKEAAELFINFLCDPEISGLNMDWVCYSTPISAARDYLDEAVGTSPVAYPDATILARGTAFDYLPVSVTRSVESLFLEVRIGR